MVKKFHQTIIDWSPYIFLVFFYENIHYLAEIFQVPSRDSWLLIADKFLFLGQLPNLLIQKIQSPILTEWLSLVYLFYLPLVIIAPLHFYFRHRNLFKKITILLCLVSAIGFWGFVLLPASGPDTFLGQQFTGPLIGGKIYYWQNFIINLVRAPRDTFPSMHVAHTAIILFFCWRKERPLFWWLLPFILSIWLSTIYLRYHYLIDLIAGLGVALTAYWLYLKIARRLNYQT